MRILFIHNGADLYGASRSLLRLTSRLVRDGNSVTVVLPFDGPLKVELSNNNVSVLIHPRLPVITRQHIRSLKGLWVLLLNLPLSAIWLWRIVRAGQIDLIHTNVALILSSGIAARLGGIPHVWHVREFFGEFGGLWPWYQRFMVFFSTRIICVSGPVADQFDAPLRQSKVRMIHNGFPLAEFGPVTAHHAAEFRNRYGLVNHRLVGVVGRIKYGRKGQEVFVRAVARVKGKFPDVKFVLIGSPFPGNEEHLANLSLLIRKMSLDDCIVYTGDVDDILAAYAALEISVLPSALPEPFGGVVVESMAMGVPVIGTRHGGTLEQIEDGVTGILVPPDDPTALAEAMERLLNDDQLRAQMGRAGRERFLRLFEFEMFYKRMLELYAGVLGQALAPDMSITV